MKPKKLLSLLLSLAMALSLLPTAAFAAETTYKDGKYTITTKVVDTDGDFEDYGITFDVTIADNKITAIELNKMDSTDDDDITRTDRAMNGYTNAKKGVTYASVPSQLIGKNSTEGVDVVSTATCTSNAIISAVNSALEQAAGKTTEPDTPAVKVDKTALKATIDGCADLVESAYTADSWKTYSDALNDANTVYAKEDATQTEVDDANTALATAKAALVEATVAPDPDPEPAGEYTYLYAALTWAEYWASEGVTAAGSTASSSEVDSKNESDKGAFDVVSRATANHGLHRGSFQCTAMIYTTDGASYGVAGWHTVDSKTTNLILTDGTEVGWSRGTITFDDGTTKTMDHYEITGTKYVPVKVKTSDLEAFKAQYTTVANGEELFGGYSENNLKAYELTAAVDENTNGLKTATLNGDTFSFSKGQTGSGSGISGADQKTVSVSYDSETAGADDVIVMVRSGSDVGSFGETIRVDLNGNYGELGSRMQSVTWTYYGEDSSYSNAIATYGTKFAADNWMHKSMGIQLGLTESTRTGGSLDDKVGYWTITIRALGYADTVIKVNIGRENIAVQTPASDDEIAELKTLVDTYANKTQGVNNDTIWKNFQTELSEAQDMLSADYTLSQAAVKEQINHLTEAVNVLDYVLVNIPYNEFYAAELNNSVPVDAMSSATLNKPRSSLAAGSYHVNSDGSDITGITYAVKVTDANAQAALAKMTEITDDSKVSVTVSMRGKETTTDYVGKDALFESASYSYYSLSEVPSYYKEMTLDSNGNFSFGAAQGEQTKLLTASAELTTTSNYGDYQIDVEGLPENLGTVKAVVLSTEEGSSYGLRHIENIWRDSELAFCTGFTTKVHNCDTSSAHYVAIMGQTINKITYYTDNGIYNISTSLYVPVKTGVTATVENGQAGTNSVDVKLSAELPADFQAVYSVEGLTVTEENGKLSYTDALAGQYTLTITDKSGKYDSITTSFLLSTDKAVAEYNNDNKAPALVAVDGVSADAFNAYLQQITGVAVNGTTYATSGRNSATIINADGTVNLDAASNGTKLFAEEGEYTLVVFANGYPANEFTFTVAADKTDDKQDDVKDNTKKDDTTAGTTDNGTNSTTGTNTSTSTSTSTAQKSNTSSTSTSVKTADESYVAFFLGALLVSGAVLTMIIVKRKEER
jgi:uncharacterized protein with FMN-binding domain